MQILRNKQWDLQTYPIVNHLVNGSPGTPCSDGQLLIRFVRHFVYIRHDVYNITVVGINQDRT